MGKESKAKQNRRFMQSLSTSPYFESEIEVVPAQVRNPFMAQAIRGGMVPGAVNLRRGEFARVKIHYPFAPCPLVCTVRSNETTPTMVSFTIGDCSVGFHPQFVEVLERGLPEPTSWLRDEIAVARWQLSQCACKDCREIVARKEALLALEQNGSEVH